MLGEDVDIGFYAEDAYAAYVTDLATSLNLVPHCRNARGATLEVVFTGPFLDWTSYQESVAQGKLFPYSKPPWANADECGVQRITEPSFSVTLHGWIEKLNAARKVQLMEPLFPARDLGETPAAMQILGGVGNSGQAACTSTSYPYAVKSACSTDKNDPPLQPLHYRILGNLDFLLHLSSGKHPRDECSSTPATPRAEKLDEEGVGISSEMLSAIREARACRDALEQRDDVDLARNAVNTVIQVAQMAEEHPGEAGTIFLDAKERVEYIQFGS